MGRNNQFFAVLSRMKLINRWGLMRNTRPENLSEHSFEVAVLAHALCEICNTRFGGEVDSGRVVLMGLYHDAAEIFTGDMPTPVKYFSPAMRQAYRQVEEISLLRLISCLPDDLQDRYAGLLRQDTGSEHEKQIVKAADKLSALIKCIEEENAGNSEFKKAAQSQEVYLKALGLPEVDYFLKEFLPAYRLTIDEQE